MSYGYGMSEIERITELQDARNEAVSCDLVERHRDHPLFVLDRDGSVSQIRCENCARLERENNTLREALQWYADQSWDTGDVHYGHGERARRVLAEVRPSKNV